MTTDLQLPVSLKVADKEMYTRSENISLGDILLSSAFLISEGSTVEVTFGVASLPDTSTQSSVRAKVLRVQPQATGDFAVAIAFRASFSRWSPKSGLRFPRVNLAISLVH